MKCEELPVRAHVRYVILKGPMGQMLRERNVGLWLVRPTACNNSCDMYTCMPNSAHTQFAYHLAAVTGICTVVSDTGRRVQVLNKISGTRPIYQLALSLTLPSISTSTAGLTSLRCATCRVLDSHKTVGVDAYNEADQSLLQLGGDQACRPAGLVHTPMAVRM